MTELEKYCGIYSSSEEQWKLYGRENCGAGAMRFMRDWQFKSLLDVGCGHNEFVKNLRKALPAVRAIGVDFACPGADIIAAASALPFADKSFDVLTCFDALEHLEPGEVAPSLSEVARVSGRFCFSICHRASVFLWQGENLHPTVQPEAWWIEQIEMAGGYEIQKDGRYLHGHWR
jgi:SAM-dependent methyltransferase